MPHTAVLSKAVAKEKPVLSHPLALPWKAIRMPEYRQASAVAGPSGTRDGEANEMHIIC